jgi:microsomal epoxide hydrolase
VNFRSKLFLFALAAAQPAYSSTHEGFIDGADGVRIHYMEAGAARASQSLLFIPGWRVSAKVWARQLDFFASKGFRVVAIDSRSQGESSVSAGGNTPENRAQDIDRVIANLALDHPTVIGWSQGVQDVAAYVDRFGTAAVANLVLVDGPVSAGPADVTETAGMVKQVLQGIGVYARAPQAYSTGMMQAIMQAPPAPLTFDALAVEAQKTPVDIGISLLVSDMLTTDRRPALKKFDKPTLVIASAESPLLGAQQVMSQTLPKSRFVTIEHARHAVFVDAPDEFNRILERFVDSPNDGGSSPRPPSR